MGRITKHINRNTNVENSNNINKLRKWPNEILNNGKLGYLTPVDNEKKLALKIINVLNNYGAAKKAQLGLKYLNRFELNSQCQKYEKFLKKIN